MRNYWHDPVHFIWARIQAQPDLGLSIVSQGLALRRPSRIEDQRKVIYSQRAHSSESLARCTTLIAITGCAVEFLLLFIFFLETSKFSFLCKGYLRQQIFCTNLIWVQLDISWALFRRPLLTGFIKSVDIVVNFFIKINRL